MPFLKKDDRVEWIGGKWRWDLKVSEEPWPNGVWLEKGVKGTVVEIIPHEPYEGQEITPDFCALVVFDNGARHCIRPDGEGAEWEKIEEAG